MACFGQALKIFKSPAAAFESLSTAQPSACFAKTVSLGLRNFYMARFGQALKPSKVPQQLSKASAPHNPPLALPSYLPIYPSNIPVEISPMGSDPPFLDTEWGALKKAYKMDGHQEFAWIQNGRAQSEP